MTSINEVKGSCELKLDKQVKHTVDIKGQTKVSRYSQTRSDLLQLINQVVGLIMLIYV